MQCPVQQQPSMCLLPAAALHLCQMPPEETHCAGVRGVTLNKRSSLAHTAALGNRGGLLLLDAHFMCCDAPLRGAESSMCWPTKRMCICHSAREAA